MKRNIRISVAATILLLGAGCSDSKQYETAMCALVDVSGTYAQEKPNVVRAIKAGLLPELEPGDSLFLITIDSNSYNEEDLRAKLTLDYIPSKANEQTLAFAKTLDAFAKNDMHSSHTDISGAMMLCSDYLKNTGSGNRAIITFSDMREELQSGLKREFRPTEFEGTDIAALNVIKLNKDTMDPEIYRQRMADWEKRVMAAGAKSWTVILDATKIPEYMERLK
ncbi:MAG TPA: VWA domain-containing protein [Gammaproteobacteria bacterium]|nr:VWA domain-containing protein [Gammaproteobacteria bacterium]